MNIQRVVIFGVGAAGGNLLLNLVAAHPDLDYTVVDCDQVTERNITARTQPYARADLHRPKVQAIQRVVQQQFGKRIETVNKRIDTFGDLSRFVPPVGDVDTLLLDCFDNAASRNLFKLFDARYPVLHVGFSGALTGDVCWNEVWEPMTEGVEPHVDVCQLHLARPFIMGLTGIAALVISEFLVTGKKRNAYFDRWLNLRPY